MAPVLRMDGFLREQADDGINNKFNQLKSPEKFRNARNTQTEILQGIDRDIDVQRGRGPFRFSKIVYFLIIRPPPSVSPPPLFEFLCTPLMEGETGTEKGTHGQVLGHRDRNGNTGAGTENTRAGTGTQVQ